MQARVFIRNVIVQAVERGFMRRLPKIFASEKVQGPRMSDETVRAIAAETLETRQRRVQLKEQLKMLRESQMKIKEVESKIDKSKVRMHAFLFTARTR